MERENDNFVTIQEFPLYSISRKGLIKNNRTNKIKAISSSKRGYPVVALIKNKKMYLRTLHILLARAFIPNPNNYPQVNHIDGDKWNYSLDNLEWCTAKQNLLHARKTGLHLSDGDKAVCQIKNGKIIKIYKSVAEASRQTHINASNIANVARHYVSKDGRHCLSAKGFQWEYF